MINKCLKCNKIFNNSYNYSRHINRKIPCDAIFKCDKCDKIFPNNSNLITHINKKIPCKKPIIHQEVKKSDVEVLLEIEKLKLEDKDKDRRHEMSKKDKERQHEKEIIELKKQSALEKIKLSETLKTERKEKTVSYINNIHIENNIQNTIQNNIKIEQNFIQNVINVYGDNPKIISIKDATDKLLNLISNDPYLTMEIVDGFDTVDNLIHDLLTRLYENINNRPLAYNKKLETYYNISSDDGKVLVKKRDFDNDIDTELKPNIYSLLEMLNACAPLSNAKAKKRYDQDFDDRIKTIEVTRLNIEEVDVQPASSQAFSVECG